MQIINNLDLKNFGLGILLITIAIVFPYFLQADDISILDDLQQSLSQNNVGLLVLAAVKLVFLNTIRAIPLYLGVFVLTLVVFHHYLKRRYYYLGIIFPFIITLLIYQIIEVFYDITYDFGVPAVTVLLGIIILNIINRDNYRILDWAFVVFFLLFGVQWLDITPVLHDFAFGRGDLSVSVKLYAYYFEVESIFNFMGLAFSSILVFASLLLTNFLTTHNREMEILKDSKLKEIEMEKLKHETLKLKADQEVMSLVHDLKTPLTTVTGLVSLLEMESNNKEFKEVTQKVLKVSDSMNEMISQILSEQQKQVVSFEEIINYALAQLPEQGRIRVNYLTDKKDTVKVNKILFARALLNLLENALEASPKTENIEVIVDQSDNNYFIQVKDRGKGIKKEDYLNIFEIGYSTNDGEGFGLPLVKKIITEHGGELEIDSKKGEGTCITIILPGGENCGENNDN